MPSRTQSRTLSPHAPSRSRTLVFAWLSVGLVLLVIVVLVVVKVSTGDGQTSSSHQAVLPASPTLVREISTVPASVFNTVGIGIPGQFTGEAPIIVGGQPPLVLNGKAPTLLYYGAEYCPYCAAERWGIAVALARFGSWHGLDTTASGLLDGDYGTLSFRSAKLVSSQLNFVPIETCTNIIDPGTRGCDGYRPLQSPTPSEQAVLRTYAGPRFVPGNTQGISFPYVDVDNRVLFSGSTYQPVLLTGLTQAEIAQGLTDSTNPVTQAIVGTANYVSASVCAGTHGSPSNVCMSSGVQEADRALGLSDR